MSPKDLYAVLGVKRNAEPQEIKKAYRKIARETHPDVKPGDAVAEQRFKEATAAFEVLSDPEKRKLYDEFGEDALRLGFDPEKARAYRSWQARPGAGRGGFEGFEGFEGFQGGAGGFGFRPGSEGAGFGFDLGEILGDLFGGGRRGRESRRSPFRGATPKRKGGDAEASMTVPLREAVLGAEREIAVDKPRACNACDGTGRVDGAPCGGCGGTGMRPGRARLKVKIPPGIGDGQKIRLAGQGLPGAGGGPPGDLYVKVAVHPHRFVRREGHDLFMELPITLGEATFGATVEAPTFQGTVKVKVPPGSQSGRKLRLKGRGVPRRKDGAGDLYLVLAVRVPTVPEDDAEARQAVETLEGRYDGDPRASLLV
jgi:molecular chaperone DnaJ